MRRRTLLGLVGTAAGASVAGCVDVFENASSSYENGVQVDCSGHAYPDRIEFDCTRYDGETGRIFPVDAGTTISITCRTNLDGGAARFVVRSPNDELLWDYAYDGTDPHEETTTVEAEDEGRYHMRVEADDVEGAFEMVWELDP